MVKQALTDEVVKQYTDMVRRVSLDYAKKFRMIDRDDIAQECWLWFAEHPNKVREWMVLDAKEGDLLFARSLRNNAMRYCVKEKARIEGYDVNDLFYYSTNFVKEMLPAVLSDDWQRKMIDLFGSTKGSGKPVSESGDWLAYASDIRKAFQRLDAEEQKLVFLFYAQEVDGSVLQEASEDRPSPKAAMMVANRGVKKMVKFLGGTKPPAREADYKDKDEEID